MNNLLLFSNLTPLACDKKGTDLEFCQSMSYFLWNYSKGIIFQSSWHTNPLRNSHRNWNVLISILLAGKDLYCLTTMKNHLIYLVQFSNVTLSVLVTQVALVACAQDNLSHSQHAKETWSDDRFSNLLSPRTMANKSLNLANDALIVQINKDCSFFPWITKPLFFYFFSL